MPKFQPHIAAKQRVRMANLDLVQLLELGSGLTYGSHRKECPYGRHSSFASEAERLRIWVHVRDEFLADWAEHAKKSPRGHFYHEPPWASTHLTPKLEGE
jgi:hypothetical protein